MNASAERGQTFAGAPAAAPMFPSTSQESINLIAHYYRGEIARMAGWRDRIDRTTNWSITCVAAMLSVSWSQLGHHEIILFAIIILSVLLAIESRRYRFFDVYRRRVRLIERHYYAQVFCPTLNSNPQWMVDLGDDLRAPKFAIATNEALRGRLRRNYIWLFIILLASWMLQISQRSFGQSQSLTTFVEHASVGVLPGWVVFGIVGVFYLTLAIIAVIPIRARGGVVDGKVHV